MTKVENNKARRLEEENSNLRDQIRDFEKEEESKLSFSLSDYHCDTKNAPHFLEAMQRGQECRQKVEAIRRSER